MPDENLGLPLPVIRHASVPPPDLPSGMVNNSVSMTLDLLQPNSAKWRGGIDAAKNTVESGFKGSPMGGIQSSTDQWAEGLIEGKYFQAAQAALSIVTGPVSAVTDYATSRKLDALQQEFMQQHGDTLEGMNRAMERIGSAMRKLSDFINDIKLPNPDTARKILDKKNNLGTVLKKEIQDRLDDPGTSQEERAQLEGTRRELDDWQRQNRDVRVARDRSEVGDLDARASALSGACERQSRRLSDAADMVDRAWSGKDTKNPLLDFVGQTKFETHAFVESLRGMVLTGRGDIEAALLKR